MQKNKIGFTGGGELMDFLFYNRSQNGAQGSRYKEVNRASIGLAQLHYVS